MLTARVTFRHFCALVLVVLLQGPLISWSQTPPTSGDVMFEKYLAQETARLEAKVLDGATSLAEWESRRPRLKQEFLDMLGLWPLPEKTPLKATVTGTLERDGVVVEKLHFQSKPGLYVTGNLYRPRESNGPLPTVLLVVGHWDKGRNGHKTHLQDHGQWFAHHGYICLIIDTLTRGEIPGEHLGTYRAGRWWWQARGYTPAGVECWNGIRAIDYLVSRPEVDPQRIAVTGISGGGATTFWIAAADDRVMCAVPASGMTDFESNVTNKIVNVHCDCMFPINTYGWEFTTVAALIAPRPMLFVNCHDDLGFPMTPNHRIMTRLRRLYGYYGKPELIEEYVSFGPPGSHNYMADMRAAIFQWLNHHVKKESATVQDMAYEFFPDHQLRVFLGDEDLPRDSVNGRIDEIFVPLAHVKLPNAGGFESWKQQLLASLRVQSFRTFPERISMSDRSAAGGAYRRDLLREDRQPDQFQTRSTETGIEVNLKIHHLTGQGEPRDRPVALIVLNEGEDVTEVPEWANQSLANEDAYVLLAPRGVGASQFTRRTPSFVERAHALLGHTVDQGRVWDIAATARWLERKPGVKVVGRGQSGILAAYAALFEPSIQEAVVLDPPVSHRTGPIFLNVLKVLDIPEALGLLAPRPLTLVGASNPAFDRTAEIYRLAGASAKLIRK